MPHVYRVTWPFERALALRKFFSHLKFSTVSFTVLYITFFKMKETCLVEIFCELDLEVYDRAVGESISKLAFESVEKIIEVSQYLNST